jgi:hypothetical protein
MLQAKEPKPTVAILYGLAEGGLIARKLKKCLHEAGFRYTRDATQADVIIAHSGGILLVPPIARAQKILLIGPPAAFPKRVAHAAAHKVWQDYRGAHKSRTLAPWFLKSSYNFGYMLLQSWRPWQLYRKLQKSGRTLPVLAAKDIAVICYRDDEWSGYIGQRKLHERYHYTFISHPRLHDDLWMYPKEYVSVLQYLYAT